MAALTVFLAVQLTAMGEETPAQSHRSSEGRPEILRLKDIKGVTHQPLANSGQKVTVLFFVMAECPIANSFVPEINRIASEYSTKGVRSFLIYAEEDLALQTARKHFEDHRLTFPGLLDPDHALARYVHATVSPEVAVLSPENKILYLGRIDDRAAAFGKRRVKPSKRDLREALDAILDGKPVPNPVTKAVGCYLTYNEKTK